MRVAFVKPDYGIVGGFELVLRQLGAGLVERGHVIAWRTIDVASLDRRPFGVEVPDDAWERAPEFFRYLGLVDAFASLDCSDFDAVVSTQPPSFAVRHPRHVSVFYHHLRIYYDLEDVYVAAGLADDPALFAAARDRIRAVDARYLHRPDVVLAPSALVRDRLLRYNGLAENVGWFHAGIGVMDDYADLDDGHAPAVGALCVSRHEFPKRTELFVHAMKLLPAAPGTVVGDGGRLPYVRSIDSRFVRGELRAGEVDDEALWLCPHDAGMQAPEERSNVRFLGRVSDTELAALYRGALCVVAPAYMEDYGLTAIEGMRFGKPVVVCDDGGGLTELVEDGVNGLVVEPTGIAIATAIQRLREDRELARELGTAARETAKRFTWDHAVDQVEGALHMVSS